MELFNHFVYTVKPQPITQFGAALQKYGYRKGIDGIIAVYIFANPKPLLQWKINGKDLDRSRYTPIDNQRLKQNEVCG